MSPVIEPVAEHTLLPHEGGDGGLLNAMRANPEHLVYFLMNVGDGDTQLVVLPPHSNDGRRRVVIVDVATQYKVPELLTQLAAHNVIEEPGAAGQIKLLVATHPHRDHTAGIPEVVRLYGGPQGCVEQFWEPGFYFPNPEFHALMLQLEESPWIVRLQPSSGTTLYLDKVKLTVLGPGVGLKSRFDTYGVNINDSSITLMIEYPASGLYMEVDPKDPDRRNRRFPARRVSRRLLLGGDAQFTSWAQTAIDFPDLQQLENPVLARELRAARGPDYLTADLFKLSHHASKHGINVELLERVGARHALVSSVAGGGSYNFPHALAMEAAREARQQIAKTGLPRLTDHELGIHITGSRLDDPAATPLGSIAALVPPTSGRPIRLFRLMDARSDPANLTRAREISP